MTDEKLAEEQLAVFDDTAVADLPALLEKQAFGRQAQVFSVPDEDGQLEVDVWATAGTW